jgi:hypothetical protein
LKNWSLDLGNAAESRSGLTATCCNGRDAFSTNCASFCEEITVLMDKVSAAATGTAAALAVEIRLQAAGCRTVIFEKRNQPGGRAHGDLIRTNPVARSANTLGILYEFGGSESAIEKHWFKAGQWLRRKTF